MEFLRDSACCARSGTPSIHSRSTSSSGGFLVRLRPAIGVAFSHARSRSSSSPVMLFTPVPRCRCLPQTAAPCSRKVASPLPLSIASLMQSMLTRWRIGRKLRQLLYPPLSILPALPNSLIPLNSLHKYFFPTLPKISTLRRIINHERPNQAVFGTDTHDSKTPSPTLNLAT